MPKNLERVCVADTFTRAEVAVVDVVRCGLLDRQTEGDDELTVGPSRLVGTSEPII